ncbi:FUSC family protein [Vibrio thalassae]|uniref:FUSC family protein n=1 Tax=Vibrio thalassae TaxID=1243014 RepID=UPI001FC9EDC1|nr:FUSC family protein [Vibrio thalassae]
MAFVLTFALTSYFQVPESTWILITLVVVIGPISYVGNVFPRAWQRAMGTMIGALSGVIAIFLGQWSILAMYAWCGIVMFFSAYFALGKRPYVGLLVGITLALTIGACIDDIEVALWRGLDVTIGCLLAVLFCIVYPQRAFIHWRMRLGTTLERFAKIYHVSTSLNLLEQPSIERDQQTLMKEMVTLRSLIAPSANESKLSARLLEAIQVQLRNMLYSLELLNTSYWSDRQTHSNMLCSETLTDCHNIIERELEELATLVTIGTLDTELSGEKIAIARERLKNSLPKIDGEEVIISGYLWLNLRLMEDLVILKRLLVDSLHPPQT